MEKIPAKTGLTWILEGFALFRKQPFPLSSLFLMYLFLMLGAGIIPVVGQALPLLLAPAFSMAFLQACVVIEQGERVSPALLLTGFRSPGRNRLLLLGVLYLIAALGAVTASSMIDDGVFWRVMTGRLAMNDKIVMESNMPLAMLFAGAIYLPAAMAFWYAAPLIAWQKMGVGKAVFYSFFAVLRAGKAFIVFTLAWIFICAFSAFISTAVGLVTGATGFGVLLLILSSLLSVILYCTFYATYVHVFGRKDEVL